MSLSMPTTSRPCSCRNFAVSLPTSPDDPVTIAMLMNALSNDQVAEDVAVVADPRRDVAHDGHGIPARRPPEPLRRLRMIGDVPRHVDGGGRLGRRHRHRT